MEAIRKFLKVKNRELKITLPETFKAEEVEVIILPANKNYDIPQWQIDEVRERTENYLANPETASDYEDFLKEIENGLQDNNIR